jgi:hypothetical protein
MRTKILAMLAAATFGVAGPGMHLLGGARSGSLLIASALGRAL